MSAIPKQPMVVPVVRPGLIVYPESDGEPMADNTKQLHWIMLILGNVQILYANVADVFVAGNLLWYAVEGFSEIRAVPDVMVAFGRPQGHRGSYLQWQEGNVAPQVVFEILSPGNTFDEMMLKLDWYEEYGVEEYYVFNPNTNFLRIYVRDGAILRPVKSPHGFVSPRMKIRFDLSGPEMAVFYPDGRRFLDAIEHDKRANDAEKRVDDEKKRADDAETRVVRLARQVELSRKARRGEASAEELAELDRLESEP